MKLKSGIDGRAAMHSLQAHSVRMLEGALYEAYRKARFVGVAYQDSRAMGLASRLKMDYRNAAAKRRRIMGKKPYD